MPISDIEKLLQEGRLTPEEHARLAAPPAGEASVIAYATPSTDSENKTGRQAQWWGRVAAVLCGALSLVILLDGVWALNMPANDTGGAMGAGMIFLWAMTAFVPILLFCLAGAAFSRTAMRKCPGPQAKAGWRLCLYGPLLVLICIALAVLCDWISSARSGTTFP